MKLFFIKISKFWTWADTFWGIWGIFGQFISPLSIFSINQPLFLQKTKPFYIQIPMPNKFLGFGYKGLVFCRNNGQRTHCTKMGADKLAKNTPNAPKFTCPNCLPKPKSLGFR